MDGVGQASSAAANEKQDDQESRKNIIVLAATNRPWDLDEALIRRLEKRIYIPLPTQVGCSQLFKINLRDINLDSSIDWATLIEKCQGYSGADISNVCREAAMMPMRRRLLAGMSSFSAAEIENLQKDIDIPLTMSDFEEALRNIQKSVSAQSLKQYEVWMKEYGAV